jgi:hypothetical protein
LVRSIGSATVPEIPQMLDAKRIDRTVSEAARETLGKEFVRAKSEPTIDSLGDEALSVLIVIEPGAADRITGDAALDTLSGIQQKLQEQGEERFAIVEYATEEELAEVDDA